MTKLLISDGVSGYKGLEYIKNSLSEIADKTSSSVTFTTCDKRCRLVYETSEYYADILRAEASDRIAEVIAVGYKYDYFKKTIKVAGLNDTEREILLASLIAADLTEDKKYAFDRIKPLSEINIDGAFNFRLKPLVKKWRDIADYMPACFVGSQLKDFVSFLLENKKKRTYIDDQKVYDNYYRRLKRCSLLGGEDGAIIREVLLSNCGEVEIRGTLPATDEKYLKEFYGDRVYFAEKNASF